MNRLRKMKGFTLIELIVVVIIIGILAAIAAVAYNQFVGTSRTTAAQATAKNVAQKITAAAAQTDSGDALAYVKSKTDGPTLATAVGADAAVLYFKDAAGAPLDAAAVTALAANGSIYVGTAAHNCAVVLGSIATVGTCK